MAWIYARSATWRRIVNGTQNSPLLMAVFGVAAVGIPLYAGGNVMAATNPEGETELQRQLRARGSVDSQMLARAQKERLQVLLDEIRAEKEGDTSGEARYRAALAGRSLGTHSSGSSAGAASITRQQH